MSSISRAGQGETISRHELIKVPTAVTFRRGKGNIPHGLKFNRDGREDNERPKYGAQPSKPREDEESERGRKMKRSTGKSKKRHESISSDSSSSSSSSTSTSSNSPSSASDSSSSTSSSPTSSSSSSFSSGSARQNQRRKRKHRSKGKKSGKGRRKRRKESKAERDEWKALQRQKVTPPNVYDGRADLAVFDKWTYEVDNWSKLSKYRDPHWGQGVTYLVGKWWVCAEFVLKLPNCYPPGKCWTNFKFAHLLVQILPGGFFTR